MDFYSNVMMNVLVIMPFALIRHVISRQHLLVVDVPWMCKYSYRRDPDQVILIQQCQMFMFDGYYIVPIMYLMTQQAMVYNRELSVIIVQREHIVYIANVFLQSQMG